MWAWDGKRVALAPDGQSDRRKGFTSAKALRPAHIRPLIIHHNPGCAGIVEGADPFLDIARNSNAKADFAVAR
jgi:hypothetical protein